VLGTIGATFYVIGIGMLYLETGTLNIADMAARLPLVVSPRPLLAGLAFITVGVCLKLALYPLHLWLPNAYAYAPSAVTAFLAATGTRSRCTCCCACISACSACRWWSSSCRCPRSCSPCRSSRS